MNLSIFHLEIHRMRIRMCQEIIIQATFPDEETQIHEEQALTGDRFRKLKEVDTWQSPPNAWRIRHLGIDHHKKIGSGGNNNGSPGDKQPLASKSGQGISKEGTCKTRPEYRIAGAYQNQRARNGKDKAGSILLPTGRTFSVPKRLST